MSSQAERPHRIARSLSRYVVRCGLSAFIFVAGMEIALRLVKFEHRPYLARVRNNQFLADIMEFRRDTDLMWAPVPGLGPFNAQGYIGADLPRERTRRTVRLACLGDSCTQYGSPAYPEIVGRLLQDRGHPDIEVMNWGVATYSTFQGLKRLERQVLPFHPDIYTICFGWNDHWIRAGLPDDVAAVQFARVGSVRAFMDEARTVQAWFFLQDWLVGPPRTAQFRVAPRAYRENLRQIIRLARQANGRVMLITAPDCLIDDKPIANHLEGLRSLGYANAAELHAAYVAITRQVCSETGVELCDAARYFSDSINGCDYFLPDRDPVHLTQPGLEVLAQFLADRLIQTGWLDELAEAH